MVTGLYKTKVLVHQSNNRKPNFSKYERNVKKLTFFYYIIISCNRNGDYTECHGYLQKKETW